MHRNASGVQQDRIGCEFFQSGTEKRKFTRDVGLRLSEADEIAGRSQSARRIRFDSLETLTRPCRPNLGPTSCFRLFWKNRRKRPQPECQRQSSNQSPKCQDDFLTLILPTKLSSQLSRLTEVSSLFASVCDSGCASNQEIPRKPAPKPHQSFLFSLAQCIADDGVRAPS